MELTVAELQGVCHLPCWGRQSHRRPFQGRTWGRRSNEGPWSFLRLPCHQFQPEGQGQRGPPRRGPRHPFLPSQPWKSQATQRSWCVRQDMGNHFQLPVTHHKVVSDCWDTTDTDSQIVGILQTLIHRLLGYYRQIHRSHVTQKCIWNGVEKTIQNERNTWNEVQEQKGKKIHCTVKADSTAKILQTPTVFLPTKLILTLTAMLKVKDTNTQVCRSWQTSTKSLG